MSFQYVYCGGWSNFRGEVAGFKGEVKGLHVLKWNRNAGVLEDNGLFEEQILGQSILAVAGDTLISVCELGKGGKVVSYRIHSDGSLERKDILEFTSAKLSYCGTDPRGKYVFVSSMGDGTVKMIRIGDDMINQNISRLVKAVRKLKAKRKVIRSMYGGIIPDWYNDRKT